MSQPPVTTPVLTGGRVIGSIGPEPTRRELRGQRGNRTRERIRALLSWALLIVAVALLWPAAWGGFTGLTVVNGQSMEPTYTTGDVVITWRQPAYGPGDVISYVVPEGQAGAGGHVIHRVLDVDSSTGTDVYTTIGDNNPTADQWAIGPEHVSGKTVLRIPGAAVLLSPEVLPYVVAIAVGGIVTVLLWSPSGRTDEDGADDQDLYGERTAGDGDDARLPELSHA